MIPDSFATGSLCPRDQFEAWREWFQPVLEVIPKNLMGDGFPAEIHIWRLGGFAISRTKAPPVDVLRVKGNLRRDPVDHWVLSYCARRPLGHDCKHLARSTFESALPLVVGTRIPARADACRPGPVHYDARRIPGYCTDARCRSGIDLGYAARSCARRLYDCSGALSAGRDGGRCPPPYQRCRRDARRRGCPNGRAGRARRTADRSRPQGAGAAGHPQAPADADLITKDSVPACRDVAIQSISAVRENRRCRPIHSDRATPRSACSPV